MVQLVTLLPHLVNKDLTMVVGKWTSRNRKYPTTKSIMNLQYGSAAFWKHLETHCIENQVTAVVSWKFGFWPLQYSMHAKSCKYSTAINYWSNTNQEGTSTLATQTTALPGRHRRWDLPTLSTRPALVCFRRKISKSSQWQCSAYENKLRWYPQQPQRFIFTNLSEACSEAKRWKRLSWVSVS